MDSVGAALIVAVYVYLLQKLLVCCLSLSVDAGRHHWDSLHWSRARYSNPIQLPISGRENGGGERRIEEEGTVSFQLSRTDLYLI